MLLSSTTNPLSAVQLRDVQDALRKPLTSRRVLIPIGSKAFVTGELCPSLDESQQETIQLRKADESGELITIARQDAIIRIQQDIQAVKPAKPATSTLKPGPAKSSLKSPSSTSKKKPSGADAGLNYFEIREEINEEGQEVHAEAVDITNHLKVWEEHVAGGATGPPAPSCDDTDDFERETIIEPKSAIKVTEEDFEALSARLDQLARLEEEEEARQSSNQKHAKKLQSTGWAKGFLNKKSSSRPLVSARAELPLTVSDTIQLSAPAVAKSETAARSATDVTRDMGQPESKTESSGRVAFVESTEVREIPRIGQRSVREIQKTSNTTTSTTAPAMQGSAISELVKERPRKNRQQERNNSSENSDNPPQQRKLSRFAQQRMGQS